MIRIFLILFVLFNGLIAYSQVVVTGVVTEVGSGKPIPSATVAVKGTLDGSLTDTTGRFSVNIPDKCIPLAITAKGYDLREVIIDSTSNITIELYPDLTPKFFIGGGFGTNNMCGLFGIRAEYVLHKGFSLASGIGQGSWGLRTGLHVLYYLHHKPYKSYIRGGFSYTHGLPPRTEITLDVTRTASTPTTQQEVVKIDTDPVTSVDLAYGCACKVGRKAKFVVEIGYCVRMHHPTYTVEYESYPEKTFTSVELSDNSKQFVEMLAPGTFILGVGFLFGI